MIPWFFSLLITLESGGDCSAIGDNGRAVGCLQIHEIYVHDVNRIYKTKYRWPEDCYDLGKSIDISREYLEHYGS